MMFGLQATEGRFSSLAYQMSKWVEQVLGPGYHNYCPGEAWSPSINLYEDSELYCLVVDLAGIAAEDMQRDDFLKVEGGVLVISGTRQTPGLEELKGPVRVHHMEIDHGRFCRTVQLPPNADLERIQASYGKGYLWVRMPKTNR